jgi:hypothetical protein
MAYSIYRVLVMLECIHVHAHSLSSRWLRVIEGRRGQLIMHRSKPGCSGDASRTARPVVPLFTFNELQRSDVYMYDIKQY